MRTTRSTRSRALREALSVACLSAFAAAASVGGQLAGDPPGEEDGYFGFGFEMEEQGARVSFVVEKGPAEKAGLLPGDLVLTLDDTSLAGMSHAEMHELVAPFRVGEKVPLEVTREDRVLFLTITLGPTPPEQRSSRAALERYHEVMREHEALEQLLRLVRRSEVLLVRVSEGDRHHIRPVIERAEWEPLHPGLKDLLDHHLRGAVSRVKESRILRIRAIREGPELRLELIPGSPSPK